MLLAELFAVIVMSLLGALVAADTGPGRVVTYAIQRRRRQRRHRRFADRSSTSARRAA
jgi:hypothetical protein